MTTRNEERLDAIRRELERQNEEWERIKAQLTQLGDVELRIPLDALELLGESTPVHETTQPAAPMVGVRA